MVQDQPPVYYRIDLEEGDGDTTEVSDAQFVEELAERTRTPVPPPTPVASAVSPTAPAPDPATTPTPTKAAVPPPPPLGPEASAFADRVRYSLMFKLGFGPDQVEGVLDCARSLMPRGTGWSK